MYCENCGKEIDGTSAFCPSCGNSVGNSAKRKPKLLLEKKFIIAILSVIAVVAMLIGINNANDVNASPEKVAEAVVISEYEADIDLMIKCFPDFTIRALALDADLPSDASRKEVKQALKEAYRYEEPVKVSDIETEVLDIYSIEEVTFLRELYDDMTDEEYDGITQIAKVKVTFQADGEENDVQVTCVKIKGKWYFLRRG